MATALGNSDFFYRFRGQSRKDLLYNLIAGFNDSLKATTIRNLRT
jgi:hypothetical protein